MYWMDYDFRLIYNVVQLANVQGAIADVRKAANVALESFAITAKITLTLVFISYH